eukprot:CAMPEP_0172685508 /NCGR_PEP_ID=MMETSP1074-20121228/20289_1 /TAXON_ID=2916 /ORGANISM="Ceratium fusus, Strain PA161109" /LENGTH=38 /DNA_ID= /DNA_START= /DNA_END= /DNA_ORIENTATION=
MYPVSGGDHVPSSLKACIPHASASGLWTAYATSRIRRP